MNVFVIITNHMLSVLRFLLVFNTLFNSTYIWFSWCSLTTLQLAISMSLTSKQCLVVAASLIAIVSFIQWLYSKTSQFTSSEFWCLAALLTVLFKQCKMLTKCNGKLLYLMLMLYFSGAWMCSRIRYDLTHRLPHILLVLHPLFICKIKYFCINNNEFQ